MGKGYWRVCFCVGKVQFGPIRTLIGEYWGAISIENERVLFRCGEIVGGRLWASGKDKKAAKSFVEGTHKYRGVAGLL